MMSIASCWWKLRFLVAEGQKEICQLSCDCSAAWGAVVQLFHTSCVIHSVHGITGDIDFTSTLLSISMEETMYAKTLWNLQRTYFQTTNFCVYLSFFASPKNFESVGNQPNLQPEPSHQTIEMKLPERQPHPKAVPCIPVFHPQTQRPLNTWRWRLIGSSMTLLGIPTRNGSIPTSKIHAPVVNSHLHEERKCKSNLYGNLTRFSNLSNDDTITPIKHISMAYATYLPIVTIHRLCGLPVLLASVGRVMRIRRWSQPRWELTGINGSHMRWLFCFMLLFVYAEVRGFELSNL